MLGMYCDVTDVLSLLSLLQVFDTAVEAAVRWCTAGMDEKPQDADDTGLPGEAC